MQAPILARLRRILPKFLRVYKPSAVIIDEAGRIDDIDILQIVRYYSAALLTVMGDPFQLGPFNFNNSGDFMDL
jgi:hypothetical protein